MIEIAAIIFAAVAAGAAAFQIALALGAPLGEYAMGGRFPGRFPPAMRLAAVVQAALLALFAGFVLSTAGVALPSWASAAPWFIWVVVAFSAVSLVVNAISRSAKERRVWVPVALVMLASSLVVALAS